MKAKDLMIGDWVEWKHATEEKYHGIYKIATIEEGWVDFYDEEGYCCSQPYDEIHPIPLTEDVRDIVRCHPKMAIFWDDKKTEETGENWYELRICKDGDTALTMEIRYVHELQHALRLLDIDIDIEL